MKNVAWKKVSQFDAPEQSPGFLLWQERTQWRRQIEVALTALGTSISFIVFISGFSPLLQ